MKTTRRSVLLAFLILSARVLAVADETASGIWAQFYSTDIKTYAANLRNAGAPFGVVTTIVSYEVNERFHAREKALQPSTVSAKSLRAEFSPERREALVQLRVEKNRLFREVLGLIPDQKAQFEWSPRVLDRLTPAERDQVDAIMDDYDAMIARVNTESRGYLLDEDREKIRFLQIERTRDLAKILTEDEVLDYELAETPFGKGARTRLKLFEPTPDQLRTYLRLAKKNDMAYSTRPSSSDELGNVRRAFERDLSRAWDPETYARYRRTTSAHFIPLHDLVERLHLDPDVAIQLYDSTRQTTEEGTRLNNAAAPWVVKEKTRIAGMHSTIYMPVTISSEQEKTARLAGEQVKALIKRHVTLARSLLGDVGYAAYYDFSRAWIDAMEKGGSVTLDFSLYEAGQ